MKKNSRLLDLFRLAFQGITFSVKRSVRDHNASITKEAMNINTLSNLPETVVECGQTLLPLYTQYLSGRLPTVPQLRQEIAETLYSFVSSTIDDEIIDEKEETDSLMFLDCNYDWKERSIDFDTNLIKQHIPKNEKIKKQIANQYDQKKEIY